MDSQQAHNLGTDFNDDMKCDPRLQYNIGKNQNSAVHLPTFLHKNEGDPALKVGLFSLAFSGALAEASTP